MRIFSSVQTESEFASRRGWRTRVPQSIGAAAQRQRLGRQGNPFCLIALVDAHQETPFVEPIENYATSLSAHYGSRWPFGGLEFDDMKTRADSHREIVERQAP